MTDGDLTDFESSLFHQLIGCSVLLVVIFGLAHNVFLSAGDPLTGKLPSTHPLTAAGFLILAGAIFFRAQWDRSFWLRGSLSGVVIALSGLRILEALLPGQLFVFAGGPMTAALETAGLYGRFSVESALFLICAFGYELNRDQHLVIRLLTVSGALAVLSLGLVETVFSFFLWGNELSLITQIAMLLVSMDLLFRMRSQVPFRGVLQASRSSFFFQFTALALYLLPMIIGAVLLHKYDVAPGQRAPLELVFAGTSWLLLCLSFVLGTYLDKRKEDGSAYQSCSGDDGRDWRGGGYRDYHGSDRDF